MNYTIEPFILENITAVVGKNPNLPSECWGGSRYSVECIYKIICPQLQDWFIQIGIIILVSFVLISWLKWWFFRWGYKKLPNTRIPLFGNLHELNTRVYWDMFIMGKFIKVALAYIGVVIYLNLIL